MEYIFFWFIAFHFTNVDHGFNGVVSHPIGKVGALYASAATLPQAASPLQAGKKPWPTMMSHVYNWLRWCFYCSPFRFRNLLRLFTWTSFRKVQKHIPMPVATGAVQMSIQPHVQIPASLGHANIAIAIAFSWNMKTSNHYDRLHLADIHVALFSGDFLNMGNAWVLPRCIHLGRSFGGWDAWDVSPLDRFQWVERWAPAHYMHRWVLPWAVSRQRNHWLTQCSIHDSKGRKWMDICSYWSFQAFWFATNRFRKYQKRDQNNLKLSRWWLAFQVPLGHPSLSLLAPGSNWRARAQNLSFRLLVLWTELVGLYENGDWFCLSIFAHLRRDYIQLNNKYYIVILIYFDDHFLWHV